MRIAHVTDCYLPRTGGIETQVRALALHQMAAGDDVRIVTATPGEHLTSGRDVADGIVVHRLTVPMPLQLPIHPRTRHSVARVLAADPVDVVHVHAGVVSPFAWGAVRAARQHRLPCVVTVHSIWGPLAAPAFGLSDSLLHWSAWGVTVTAVSRTAADSLEAAVPAIAPVLITPNGIEAGAWTVQHVPAEPGELRLVTVMRLAPRKRLMPLLRIVEMAHRSLLGTARLSLTVIGDGPDRSAAERFIASRGLAGVIRLAGRQSAEQIREAFARADLFVQPSVRESFGLAALEARSAGLPVLARSQSGTAHFIRDGVEGVLVDSDRDMVRALLRLARTPAQVARIAKHNASTAPDESWPQVLELVSAAYARAMSASVVGGATVRL